MKLNNYKKENATHYLSCRHAVGRNGRDYFMACIILKKMPDNRLKILVFGERNWKGYENKKQIKYVDDFRVKPKSNFKEVEDKLNTTELAIPPKPKDLGILPNFI